MKIAIIDLGTNTFNLLIVDIGADTTYHPLFHSKLSVKLGEGGIHKGFIGAIPFQRGIDALKIYKEDIEKFGVEKIHAFGTSAIRGASNGKEFIEKIKEEVNISVQIISGDREAELIYFGVRNAVALTDEKSLIIDIGGGSTEFIIANKNEIFWKKSFLLGAARLLELLKPSDPFTEKDIKASTDHLNTELQPLFEAIKEFPVRELIGSSGSFDSLAEMIAHKFHTPEVLLTSTEFTFNIRECISIYKMLLKSNKIERLAMKGLVEMRVDMMVISSILVHFVVTRFKIKKMRLSHFSLKEGVLHELMNNNSF